MVVVGGIDTIQNPFMYLGFAKTEALSPLGQCRPYDANADGIAISEGVAVIVLKRLSDAERDGDRIYSVIQGVGASSDGRSKGLTAPLPQGQVRALKRAYDKANVSPADVGLIEGHGTGTVVGDRAEVEAITGFLESANSDSHSCALGSVKSMIGHTKCTAGVAGLIKATMALHSKILPPTLGVTSPNPALAAGESPIYVNTEARPWINGKDHPRYAGISAFGFGGTNFHVVVEEYADEYARERSPDAPKHEWPSELFVWRAPSRQKLVRAVSLVDGGLADGAQPSLRDLAYTLSLEARTLEDGGLCLAIVAESLDDLQQKLARALEILADPTRDSIDDPGGIYFAEEPLANEGKVAFIFPGQGSQYVNMLRDLTIHFPEVQACFERADEVLKERMPRPLSGLIFPPPRFTKSEEAADKEALTQTNVAQPALGATSLAMLHLLKNLGVEPHFAAGHSYGEFVALCSAGAISEDDLYAVSEARGRFIMEESGPESGAMCAVQADRDAVAGLLAEVGDDAVIGNLNTPRQTVVSGTEAAIGQLLARCESLGIRARRIPVSSAFHSPLVAGAQSRLADLVETIDLSSPRIDVYSNVEAAPYPREPEAIRALLAEHLVRPVNFIGEVEALYEAGARVFVEVGPGSVMRGLTGDILGDLPHLSVASDQPNRSGIVQLHHLLGQLAAHGVGVVLDYLYLRRPVRRLDVSKLVEETAVTPLPPTTWLVNGGKARPLGQPVAESRHFADQSAR